MSLNFSLLKKSFSLDVLTLAGGTAFAQVIGLMVVPLLTRLYTPSDYGSYALYTAGFNLLVPLIHFRYALAIMLPKEDQEAYDVLRLSLGLSFFSGIVIFAVIHFCSYAYTLLPGVTDNLWILALIALALVFGGSNQAYSQWANRMKNYVLMSLSRTTQVGGMVITQSISGFIGGSTILGLVFGHVFGHTVGLATLIAGQKDLRNKSLIFLPAMPLIKCLSRYKRFPFFNFWGSILDGVTAYGTPLLFALYFQSEFIGKYSLAHTVLSAPVMLIGHSISKVLFQRMSENVKAGLEINDIVRAILLNLIYISMFFGAVIYFFGPVIFGIFFGANWFAAGHFAQILVPAMFFQFIISGLSTVLLVKERQDLLLYAQIILALTTVISILVPGIAGWDEINSLTVFSITRAASNMVYLAIICRIAKIF